MKIALDPGHGGRDRGGESLGADEKDIVLIFQPLLWKALADRGHTVLTTRVTDVFVELADRAKYANDRGADCLLSLHCNASSNARVRGPWTIHAAPSTSGQELAFCVQRELGRAAGGDPGAVYPDASAWVGDRRLAVLRRTSMPAVIVELGFMTNPTEIKSLEDPRTLVRLAEAVARGVHEWKPR